ncbi:hypothetical protein FRC07_002210 [Ceratobasidium sp. 392]|nr:hypothetical protein FRC07_002210 [Ceratobasidium sp. 392]
MTPTPPPPEQPNNTLALGEIAHGIARLDPLLARYNIRSNPLFLSRNLRDGWVEKVRAWDREGTTVQARPRSPVPNQFATREERFKAFVADAVRRAPTAMGNSQKAFDLRSFTIGISQSTANFFPAPYRIPPSGNSEANNNRTDAVAPWFIRVTEDEENVTLRALTLPGGIAYVDLLLYDFADESMDLQGGIGLPWSAAKATQVYARVEIAGPDGFSATSQLVPLVWLRHEFRDRPGVQTDLQPPAFLHVDLEWGSDSAAPLIRPRIFKPAPQLQPTPPRNIEARFNKKKQDPVTGEDIFDIKLILPPEAIELSDDEEEAPVTQAIAPSTRIGALLAASTEDTIQQVHVEASTSAEAIGTMPSTPPRVLNQIKEEEEEQNENWQTNNIDLLPISRARSHSPTPALDSPVRRRRDHDPSSPTSPTRPNRSTPAPEAFAGGYSSRTHNKSRIYDVLRQLPMNYGVLTGQIIANEEEMFAEDYVLEGHEGFTTVSEEARLMGALWSRWVAVEKYDTYVR